MTPVYSIKPNSAFDIYNDEVPFDFAKAKAEGCILGIYKATDGEFGQEPNFQVTMKAIKDAGLYAGCYHFFEPNHAFEQANNYINFTKANGGIGDMMPIVDFEDYTEKMTAFKTLGAGALQSQLKEILDMFETAFGQMPMIYSAHVYLDLLGWPSWLGDYPIWLAATLDTKYEYKLDGFPTLPTALLPSQLNPDSIWIWQYTWSGRSNGYSMNDYDLVMPKLLQKLNINSTPVPEPQPVPQPSPSPAPVPQPSPDPIPTSNDTNIGSQIHHEDNSSVGSNYDSGNPNPVTPARKGYLYYLKTLEEYSTPPKFNGSFCAIGGRGQDNWIQLGKNEIKFLQSIGQNSALWKWASTVDKGTIYIRQNDAEQTTLWPLILLSSRTNPLKRQMVRVLEIKNGMCLIDAIPYQKNGDYSQFTPDKYPEYWLDAWTANKNGTYGMSHNEMLFKMGLFDPTSGFKISSTAKGFGGFWVDVNVLYGKV